MKISGTTRVYGIFGHPVEHTFSPGMHNAAFAKIGLDACYVAFAVHPDRLGDAVRSVFPLGIRGLNITVPHKEKVLPHLDELSEEAGLIGAVNTIEVNNGRLIGHNTDGRGFIRSLREDAGFNPRGRRFLVLGAGGAARAVCFSLALAGAKRIVLHDVDNIKAERLVNDLRAKAKADAHVAGASSLSEYAGQSHSIINATPLGLKKSDPLPIKKEYISNRHLVCDLVYNPAETGLLKAAKARAAARLGGIGMLLFQGVIAFEIWTGRRGPVAVMKKALSAQIASRR